jgi:hypothetical protein
MALRKFEEHVRNAKAEDFVLNLGKDEDDMTIFSLAFKGLLPP